MRGLNPWTQRLLTAKPRGKPPASLFFCDYQEMGSAKPPFTRYVRARSGTARGDPKGIPRDGPGTGTPRSRGDPGG